MDVLFLSCAYSETQKALFMETSKRGYQFAAQNLQEALFDGFIANDVNLTVLSIPSLSTYPTGCSLLSVKDEPFVFRGKACGKSIGYLNLPFVRGTRSIRAKTLKEAKGWYDKAGEYKVVFVYALLGLQMSLAVEIKKHFPDVKLCIIVPDLPRFMGYNRILKKLGFQEKYFRRINSMVPKFDGFVVLAEPMIQDLKVEDKPCVVVEGIFSGDSEDVIPHKSENKVILYTGNIGERYGIQYLLKAFEIIKDPNYRLQIRGTGDNTLILNYQEKDSRIEYIGPLSRHDLVQLQKDATLLVNPVTPDKEFTRYFFPSKTMDYLASGTPTVMFKLDCLPSEYDNYLFFFEDTSAVSMSETLKNICERDQKDLDDMGTKAAEFIRSQKNPQKQVEKIINLFSQLFKNENSRS